MLETLFTPEVQAAILLAVANTLIVLITGILGLASRQILTWIRSKTTLEQQRLLEKLAASVVTAAEGIFADAEGDKKLAWAMDRADTYLKNRGLNVTTEQLRAVIESAVFDEINRYKHVSISNDLLPDEPANTATEYDPPVSTPRITGTSWDVGE